VVLHEGIAYSRRCGYLVLVKKGKLFLLLAHLGNQKNLKIIAFNRNTIIISLLIIVEAQGQIDMIYQLGNSMLRNFGQRPGWQVVCRLL
jgi:hypothetical protein